MLLSIATHPQNASLDINTSVLLLSDRWCPQGVELLFFRHNSQLFQSIGYILSRWRCEAMLAGILRQLSYDQHESSSNFVLQIGSNAYSAFYFDQLDLRISVHLAHLFFYVPIHISIYHPPSPLVLFYLLLSAPTNIPTFTFPSFCTPYSFQSFFPVPLSLSLFLSLPTQPVADSEGGCGVATLPLIFKKRGRVATVIDLVVT